jgi:hypothetical protein
MIKVAKAPDGAFSYVVKMPDGEIVLGGDGCESLEEVQKFFADIVAIATDTPCDNSMIHLEMVASVDLPEDATTPQVTTTPEAIYPLGGTDMMSKKMSAPRPKGKKK